MRRHHSPHCAKRTIDVLLSGVPALSQRLLNGSISVTDNDPWSAQSCGRKGFDATDFDPMTPASGDNILVETRGAVGIMRLNRPKALNALNAALMADLGAALARLEADPDIGCLVLTGSEQAFAAGADIKEMADKTSIEAFLEDFAAGWDGVARARKPTIAAVAGYALGGGCELAMMCDFIIAADNAKFGQPEIKLGVIPGIGGTQRLTRAVGKAKAMDLCLTGRMMDAAEAERAGLVARVVPLGELMDTALAAAETIAELSRPAVMLAKESINRAFELPLAEGIRFERRVFHSLFATADQKEGMAAFIAKRAPRFTNR
jgi:enoyl-CoA hydratase